MSKEIKVPYNGTTQETYNGTTIDISKRNEEDIKEISYYHIENRFRLTAGKVLTLIDASIPDKQQNKAFKDLVKQIFSNEIWSWQKHYWGGKKARSIKLEPKDSDPIN